MFNFVNSVVSLVEIGTFLHKMGGGVIVYLEGELTSGHIFYRARCPFCGLLYFFFRFLAREAT